MEAERRGLLIDFGKEVIHVLSSAKDGKQAQALIQHLRRLYFIDEEARERARTKVDAEELIRLSQLTYRITPKAGGGGTLEIGN